MIFYFFSKVKFIYTKKAVFFYKTAFFFQSKADRAFFI